MAYIIDRNEDLIVTYNEEGIKATHCVDKVYVSWEKLANLLEEHKKMNGDDDMDDLDTEKIILKTIGKLSEELMKNRNECAHMKEEIDKLEIEINLLDEEIKKKDKVIDCEVDKLLKSGNMMVRILDDIILTNTYIVATQIYSDEVYKQVKYHRNSIVCYINIVEKYYADDVYAIASLKSTIYKARMFVIEVLR